jgi:hypothetical protein
VQDASVQDASSPGDADIVDAAAADAAPDAALVTDPFDALACTGPGITFAEATAKLPSNADNATLGTYTLLARERTCDEVGTCSAWGEPYQAAAKHYGGNTTGGFALHGDLVLRTKEGLIDVTPIDASIDDANYTSISFVSPTTAGPLVFPYVDGYGYESQNNGFIPPLPVHDGWLATFVLTMTTSCAQFRSLEVTPNGSATKQYAALVRY